jgi:hypothetical protein
MNRVKRDMLVYFFLAIAPAWIFPLGGILAFSPSRLISKFGLFLINMELIGVLGMLGAIGVVLSSPILLFFKRFRQNAVSSLVLVVIFIPCYALGIFWELQIRFDRMELVLERGQPIVGAIEAYEQKNGHPPGSLNELVPDYLDAIPATGIGVLPTFHYWTGEPKDVLEGNEWILIVHPPSVVMSFDSYKYFPRQNYPEESIRIGTWVYRRRG